MSAVLRGVEAIPVTVEVVICSGIPGISIVGMADTAVQEARERVRASIRSAGFDMPNSRIIINLAPCSMKKGGSAFDLPIALGVLAATSQIDAEALRGKLFVGELSLEGAIRPVAGILSYAVCAKRLGLDLVSAGKDSVPVSDLVHLGLDSLQSLHLEEPFHKVPASMWPDTENIANTGADFRDISGHEVAKRAMQIAAAGRHGLLMVGPPGSGKTMLASRMPSILPPLSREEMLEAAMVHSVAGEDMKPVLKGLRPFRSPHHSATVAGLIGGGSPIRPGEVSLAHCGALFLDELPEFKVSAIQSLRQVMESGTVNITRADGNIAFPARFMLLAASNPCPCGYLGDAEHKCRCTVPQVRKYQSKIGGPILDRIDMQLNVGRIAPSDVLDSGEGTDSSSLREGVMQAMAFKSWRLSRGISGSSSASSLQGKALEDSFSGYGPRPSSKQVIEACSLKNTAEDFLVQMAKTYALSGRGLISTLSVARTIADMEESEAVEEAHIAEALGFRIRGGIGDT